MSTHTDRFFETFKLIGKEKSVELWLQIYENHGELIAAQHINQAIIDCIYESTVAIPSTLVAIRVPNFDSFEQCNDFVKYFIQDKEFVIERCEEHVNELASFLKEITLKSPPKKWQWMTVVYRLLNVLTLHEKTAYMINMLCIRWFEGIASMDVQPQHDFKEKLIECIDNCLNFHEPATEVAVNLLNLVPNEPIYFGALRNDLLYFCQKILKKDAVKSTSMALHSLLCMISAEDQALCKATLELCLSPQIVEELNALMCGSRSLINMKASFELAIKIQSMQTRRDIFSRDALDVIFTNDNLAVRKYAVTLYHDMVYDENDPAVFIQRTFEFYNEFQEPSRSRKWNFAKSMWVSDEFADWDYMFNVILQNRDRQDLVLAALSFIIRLINVECEYSDEYTDETIMDMFIAWSDNFYGFTYDNVVLTKYIKIIWYIDLSEYKMPEETLIKLIGNICYTLGNVQRCNTQHFAAKILYSLSENYSVNPEGMVNSRVEKFLELYRDSTASNSDLKTIHMNLFAIIYNGLITDKTQMVDIARHLWRDMRSQSFRDLDDHLLGYKLFIFTEACIKLLQMGVFHNYNARQNTLETILMGHSMNTVINCLRDIICIKTVNGYAGYSAFSSLCKIYYHFPSTKEFNYGPCFIEFDENAIDILSEQLANQVNLMVKGLVNANEFFWSRIKDMVCNLSRCYTKVTKIAPWRLIVAIINVLGYQDLTDTLLRALLEAPNESIYIYTIFKIIESDLKFVVKEDFITHVNKMLAKLPKERRKSITLEVAKRVIFKCSELENNEDHAGAIYEFKQLFKTLGADWKKICKSISKSQHLN